ncbi:hypothetical protein FOA52_001762 [Chlamydomonas sp. UWO 241]|nr:hypothetical protein FOA52_001762 [Chlamydomonas sp. UWO 241]
MEEVYLPRHHVAPTVCDTWVQWAQALDPRDALPRQDIKSRQAWGGGAGGVAGGGGGGAGVLAAAQEGGLQHKKAGRHKQVGGAAPHWPPGGGNESVGGSAAARDPFERPPAKHDIAGPYQKEAAQRAATRSIQPWNPIAGMGERAGATLADEGAAGLGKVWQASVAAAVRQQDQSPRAPPSAAAPYAQPAGPPEMTAAQREQVALRQLGVRPAPYAQPPPLSAAERAVADAAAAAAFMGGVRPSPYAHADAAGAAQAGPSGRYAHELQQQQPQQQAGGGVEADAGGALTACAWAQQGGGGGGDGPGEAAGQQGERPAPEQAGAGAPPMQPPTDLFKPSPAQAAAYAQAAGRVARAGTGQIGADDAYSPLPGKQPRQIWPADLDLPPRYCTGCRGGHMHAHEKDPNWEPFSPQQRLSNLHMLKSQFQNAQTRGILCVKQNNDSTLHPITWLWRDGEGNTVKPGAMSEEQFVEQVVLMFDGLREGHEPYRHLATQAALEFLATKSPFLAKAAPKLVRPLRYAMQTYEPHLFGHAVWMLAKLLRSHPRVGRALRPHLKHFLGYMGLFRQLSQTVHLPPPFCVAPAGSFSGRETAATSKVRACHVCSAPLDKDAVRANRTALDTVACQGNAHKLNEPQPEPAPPRSPAKGRKCGKVHLPMLIDDTLELMVLLGGPGALAVVQKVIPRYTYFSPPA